MIGTRAAAVALAALTLAGCGSHGTGASGTPSPTDLTDQQVKFAQCMRQHGVDMPDPTPGQQGFKIRVNGNKTKLDAATNACRKYSPKANVNPNDPQVRDRMLRMAECLRRNGLNVPDPQPGQGLNIRIDGKDSSTANRAMETCRREVPPLSPSPTGG